MSDISSTRDAHRRRSRRSPVGAPPGTLIADPRAEPSRLRATVLSPFEAQTLASIEPSDIPGLRAKWPIVWIDCVGLGTVDLIAELGDMFGLHRLALEDVVNAGQRPKADFFDDHAFVVLKMIDRIDAAHPEQISIFFGEGFVLTFQENEGDCFDPVRKRIATGGRLLTKGADYLAYALIDSIVDAYFPLLDQRGEEIDAMEDGMLAATRREQATRLHHLRRQMMVAKRWLWPVRDAIGTLMRTEATFLSKDTKVYLNDTYDHSVRLIDIIETYRETLTGLIELHHALSQAKTNEVINLLTIVSTIFIPLTFLVGVWGMNFDTEASPWNMPELHWYYGYPAALGLMLAIAVALVTYFRWKRWL